MLYQEAHCLSHPAGDEVGSEAQEDLAPGGGPKGGVPLLRVTVLSNGLLTQPPLQLHCR